MIDRNKVREGDNFICVNDEDWGYFEEGGVYTVTELWDGGVDLDNTPVASCFFADFDPI